MKTINLSDTLFVTLTQFGSVVINFSICGITSMAELLMAVRKKMSGRAGIVTMNLRNRTQGWSRTEALLLAA